MAIRIRANGRRATAEADEPITTGSVGIPVRVFLSEEYDGLQAVVCFRCGGRSRDVPYTGGDVAVPASCLQVPGETLMVGVYAAREDGTVVIPTVWASAGTVRQGVEPSGVTPGDPDPSWIAQVQQMATEALEKARQAYRYHIAVRDGRVAIIDTGGE